jgi:hypothetical protein
VEHSSSPTDHGIDLTSDYHDFASSLEALDDWDFESDVTPLPRGRTTSGLDWQDANRRATEFDRPARFAPHQRTSSLVWGLVWAGIGALIGGGGILFASCLAARNDLWSLGLAIALGGQASLVLGLLVQLERVWLGSHNAVSRLNDVDRRLQELNHTADVLGLSRSTAAQSFYAHMAQGASPRLLLADIKGQLDLVAMRISDEH